MLKTRADGHMPHDCGHWCLPGPYDIGAKILFNAIVGQIEAPISSLFHVGRPVRMIWLITGTTHEGHCVRWQESGRGGGSHGARLGAGWAKARLRGTG